MASHYGKRTGAGDESSELRVLPIQLVKQLQADRSDPYGDCDGSTQQAITRTGEEELEDLIVNLQGII